MQCLAYYSSKEDVLMNTYKNKLLLIDGYALLYRGYYGFRGEPLRISTGEDIVAGYAFLRSFIKVLEEVAPTHVGVAFDLGGKTFRHEMFPEYKSNRPPTPPEIKFGLSVVRDYLKTLNIIELWAKGYEADDVIGTIVQHFASEDTLVLVMSPDKDFRQLLRPHVQLLRTKPSGEMFVEAEEDLLVKYKIKNAAQFIDILALWGDAADNVPGVSGIGEKTAASLISMYGSIEYLYGNIAKLKSGIAEKLRNEKESLLRSQELIRIRLDAPIPEELKQYELHRPADSVQLRALNDRYEFRQLGEKLVAYFCPNIVPTEVLQDLKQEHTRVEIIATKDEFQTLIEHLRELSASYGLAYHISDNRLQSLVLSFVSKNEREFYYIDCLALDTFSVAWQESLLVFLARGDIMGYVYDLKKLLHLIAKESESCTLRDILLAHYLLAPDRNHSLENLCNEVLHCSLQTDPTTQKEEFSHQQVVAYCCECAQATHRLGELLVQQLAKEGLADLFTNIEMPLVHVLTSMEAVGVALNPTVLQYLHTELEQELSGLQNEIRKIGDEPTLNVSSPKQIGQLLFEKLQIAEKPKRTPSKQYNTSEGELLKYVEANPIVEKILQYREKSKILSTYIDPLPRLVDPATGLLHASFNQAVAATGRLSSSNPNLQNIPVRTEVGRKIREAFVSRYAENGVLLSLDYSQIELRIMAHIAEDEHMIAAFVHGQDIHAATAARIYDVPLSEVTKTMRERAKRVNFGIIYGISAFGLAKQIGTSAEEAEQFINTYFERYPSIKRYMDATRDQVKKLGYVKTLFGRKRYFNLQGVNPNEQAALEREAINMPIQGTAADLIKLAMLRIAKQLRTEKFKTLLTTQVHDELIFDVPNDELTSVQKLVRATMESVYTLRVPLVVDVAVGDNWGQL